MLFIRNKYRHTGSILRGIVDVPGAQNICWKCQMPALNFTGSVPENWDLAQSKKFSITVKYDLSVWN